jgi:uncharacterized HAD superfamily protein/hypoxanthine phosphoribosyltransferase
MQYRSIADLAQALAKNFSRIPNDIDLVVGIPRSGLLPANILSLSRNLPLSDLEGFIAGRIFTAGRTKQQSSLRRAADAKHVIVIDDSINSGISMRDARNRIATLMPGRQVTYCAVYGNPHSPNLFADLVLEEVPWPRMFEWNLMHNKLLQHCCFDIDGVLCYDPMLNENDDGDAYLAFLANARPLHLPTRPIGHLVTSRLEKYRVPTEDWLKSNGVRYGRLWMLDLPSAEERRRLGAHATFKARVYRRTDALLFVESEPVQARRIASLASKPVLSLPEQVIVYGEDREDRPAPPPQRKLRNLARRCINRIRGTFEPLGHFVKGNNS